MSASQPRPNDAGEACAAKPRDAAERWADEELFDHIAEIINENYILEVEAGLELEGRSPSSPAAPVRG